MASVGYGFGNYGKSFYGEPVFEFGEATIAQTSSVVASGSITLNASSSIDQTSGFTSAGTIVFPASATIAQTSGFTSTAEVVILGSATIAQTSGFTATGTQIDAGEASIDQTSGFTATCEVVKLGLAKDAVAMHWGIQAIGVPENRLEDLRNHAQAMGANRWWVSN